MARGDRSTDAINNPVQSSRELLASQQDIGVGNERLMKSTGPAKESLAPQIYSKVSEQPYDDEKMAMLAFMNEPVEIRLGTSGDPNAEQVFELIINNKLEFFRRGETKTVPRYFVDRMMRLKETRYSQKEVLNAEGIKDIIQIPITSLKYDFSITRDANPIGKAWERAVLAEPG